MLCDIDWIEDANVYGVSIPGKTSRNASGAVSQLLLRLISIHRTCIHFNAG